MNRFTLLSRSRIGLFALCIIALVLALPLATASAAGDNPPSGSRSGPAESPAPLPAQPDLGIVTPDQIDPSSLASTQLQNTQVIKTLTISNPTSATLTWRLDYPIALAEAFDNVPGIFTAGWYRQNNSTPLGILFPWFQGVPIGEYGPFDAHTGAPNAYIAANFNATSGGSGVISGWLLTPVLDISSGGYLTFWTRKPAIGPGMTDYPDRLEIRLNPTMSTNVGTASGDVGDFTALLHSINPNLVAGGYPYAWTRYDVPIPLNQGSSGRAAFRYYVTGAGPLGSYSDYIGVDTFSYHPAIPWAHLPGGGLPPSGSLAPGQSQVVNVTFDSTGLAPGTYTASLLYTENGASTPLALSMTVLPAANLNVTLTRTPEPVLRDQTLAYTLEVSNAGPSTATNLTAAITLPTGAEFLQVLPTAGSCAEDSGVVTCSLASLPASGHFSAVVEITPPQGAASFTASAFASADEGDLDLTNNSAQADSSVYTADLALTQIAGPDAVSTQALFASTFQVANAGPDYAAGPTFEYAIPAGMDFITALPTSGTCGIELNVLTCLFDDLGPAQTAGVTITLFSPSTPVVVTHTAAVSTRSYDPNGTNDLLTSEISVELRKFFLPSIQMH